MFRFWTHSGSKPKFSGPLKVVRCAYVSPDGVACPVHITVGLPFCRRHLALEGKVVIKESVLVPGELGLFVDSPGAEPGDIVFRPRDNIVEYVGDDITAAELQRRYGAGDACVAPYVLHIGDEQYIDAACVRGAAACANGVGRVSDGANAGFHVAPVNSLRYPGRAVMHATKRLRQGDEIIVAYGKAFFKPGDTSRHTTDAC